MKLYILENESTVGALQGTQAPAPDDAVVCLNYLCLLRARRELVGCEILFGEDLLDAGDYNALHAMADRVALGWYHSGDADPTLHDGISYGHLTRAMFGRVYMIPVLVKYGEIIRKALERRPGCRMALHDLSGYGASVHLYEGGNDTVFDKDVLVRLVCGRLGVEVARITPPEPMRASFVVSVESGQKPESKVKKCARNLLSIAERTLNLWGRILDALRGNPPRIYFYNYSNLNSMLPHFSGRFILRSLRKEGLRPAMLRLGLQYVDFNREPYSPSGADRAFFDGLMARYADGAAEVGFDLNGIDYEALYRQAIRDLAQYVIPRLVTYAGRVRGALRRYRICTLIDNNTLDERSKTVLSVCRQTGVRTVFVDHGIMGHRKAMRAAELEEPDVVVGPGEYDPYGHRAPRIVLGNPAMDPYTAQKRRSMGAIRRVLFLTFEDNFYARLDRFAYQEKYYEEIFSIFPALKARGIEVLYKPHPGESDTYHRYLFRFFGIDDSAVKFVQQRRFIDVVQTVDLVVSNVSSCYFEALAAGVPTIFMEPHYDPSSFCAPLSGRRGEDVLVAETGAELLTLIDKHADAPDALNGFVSEFLERGAPLYLGRADGEAGRRIVDYVLTIG